MARALAARPDMKGQNFNEGRDVLDYIAFETLFHSVQGVHIRQFPTERLVTRVHKDFRDCLADSRLRTVHEYSPLWGKGRNINTTGMYAPVYDIPLQSKWDKKLLDSISHTEADTRKFIEECLPNLATLDRGQVKIYEEEFRKQMWALLEPYNYFTPELQARMRQLMIDTWGERMVDTIEGTLERIGEETADDLLRAKHLATVREMDDETLANSLKERGVKARRDRNQNIVMLAEKMMETESAEVFNLIEITSPSQERLLESIRMLLDDTTTDEETVKANIRKKLPALEYLALAAAQDENVELLMKLQPMLNTINKKLKLIWGEYPAMAFVQYVIASYCDIGPTKKLLVPRDLMTEL
jgi:hypothetical protein